MLSEKYLVCMATALDCEPVDVMISVIALLHFTLTYRRGSLRGNIREFKEIGCSKVIRERKRFTLPTQEQYGFASTIWVSIC